MAFAVPAVSILRQREAFVGTGRPRGVATLEGLTHATRAAAGVITEVAQHDQAG